MKFRPVLLLALLAIVALACEGQSTLASTASAASTSTATAPSAAATAQTVTVVVANLNLRAAPDTGSEILAILHDGDVLIVLEASNGWLRVESAAGITGWVRIESVTCGGACVR